MSTITLQDGRRLFYAEYGHPLGLPVFFFHGTPGSHVFRPADEITLRAGVRLITTDRPGYGSSDFLPGRCLLDWSADVAALADALGISAFHVIGTSGGGPHALACAYALPERVLSAIVVSGAGPVESPEVTAGMTRLNRLGFLYARTLPWSYLHALIWLIYRRRAKDPQAAMDRGIGRRPDADDRTLESLEIRELCRQSETEAFRPGLRGMAWEFRLITRPWGFRLAEIKVPVALWHGTEDDTTSPAMSRSMADSIPNSKLHIIPGEGHMLLLPYWENILKTIAAADFPRVPESTSFL